jgi:hypothetical protein
LCEGLRSRSQARRLFDTIKEVQGVIEHLAAKSATSRMVGLQGRSSLAQAPDFGTQLVEHQPAINLAASTAW